MVESHKTSPQPQTNGRYIGGYRLDTLQIMTIGNDFQNFFLHVRTICGDFELKRLYRSQGKTPRLQLSTGLDEIGQFFGPSDGSAVTRT